MCDASWMWQLALMALPLIAIGLSVWGLVRSHSALRRSRSAGQFFDEAKQHPSDKAKQALRTAVELAASLDLGLATSLAYFALQQGDRVPLERLAGLSGQQRLEPSASPPANAGRSVRPAGATTAPLRRGPLPRPLTADEWRSAGEAP